MDHKTTNAMKRPSWTFSSASSTTNVANSILIRTIATRNVNIFLHTQCYQLILVDQDVFRQESALLERKLARNHFKSFRYDDDI